MRTAMLISAFATVLQFQGVRGIVETLAGGIGLYMSWKLLDWMANEKLKSCGGRIW
jgi:hypothetical protein